MECIYIPCISSQDSPKQNVPGDMARFFSRKIGPIEQTNRFNLDSFPREFLLSIQYHPKAVLCS